MPTVQEISKDPNFYKLPFEERRKVFLTVDPNFGGLPGKEQTKVLRTLEMRNQVQLQQSHSSGPELLPSHGQEESGGLLDLASRSASLIGGSLGNPEDWYRPALEGGGAAAGGIIGSGAGPIGAAGGGALGYGMGKNIANRIDEFRGLREPPSLIDLVKETGQDLATGATFEMGGQMLAPAAMGAKRGGQWVYDSIKGWASKSFTKKGVEQAAGKVLVANTSHGPIYAKNAEQAAAIEKEIPGLKFTFGQKTGDPAAIKLERTQIRRPGTGAEKYFENIENNSNALTKYFNKNLGGKETSDEMLTHFQSMQNRLNNNVEKGAAKVSKLTGQLPYETPQTAGLRIVDKIEKAKEPIKKTMGILEEAVPDYPMKFDKTRAEIQKILVNKKLSSDQIKAVKTFSKEFEEIAKKGESTHRAFGIRRTLNDRIELSKSNSVKAIFGDVKRAMIDDLASVSDLARTGKMATYKGKAVFPDELAEEYERNLVRLPKVEKVPDTEAMVSELKKRGMQAVQVTHETKKAFSERIARDYSRVTGKKPPFISSEKSGEIKQITQRQGEIKKIFQATEPGKDVAASMKAYNEFASREYFGRFDRGAVSRVSRKGKEAYGIATRLENIPANFATASGAEDLINAIGKKQAKDVMSGHLTYDFFKSSTNPATGLVDAKRLARWLSKNKIVLQKFGLYDDYGSILKAQDFADKAVMHVKDFEKSIAGKLLKTDPERAIKVSMMGGNTGRAASELMKMVGDNHAAKKGLQHSLSSLIDKEMRKATTFSKLNTLMDKYMPALKAIYKDDPKKIKAVQTMQRAYKAVMRNTKSPIGFGSDTAENILTELGKVNVLSRTVNVTRTLFRTLKTLSQNKIDDLVTRALFDPDYAQPLIDGVKYNIKPKDLKKVINAKVTQLDTYRNRRIAQAVAAGGLVIKGKMNGNSD